MEEDDGPKRSSPLGELSLDSQGDNSAKKARTNMGNDGEITGDPSDCVHAMQSLQTKTSSILSPGHHHDPNIHVHFPDRNVHGPDIYVDLEGPDTFFVHVGFLQIHRRYEARFILQHRFGPQLCAPPLQNSEVVTIREITPQTAGKEEGHDSHSVCLEIHPLTEGICKEDLILTTGDCGTKSVHLMVYAQVLARDKGPPLLKEGVKCVGTDKEIVTDPQEMPKTAVQFSEEEDKTEVADQNDLKKPSREVRFGAEKLSPVDEESSTDNKHRHHPAGHVHFPADLHGPELRVTQTDQDHFSVNLGFLQIHRTYQAKFTLRHSFGPRLSAPPLQSVYFTIKEIHHNVDSKADTEGNHQDSHTLVLEVCTEKDGVVKEELFLTTEEDATKKMWVELHARIMGKGKGTPLLKEGVRCTKVNVEEDSEISDWAGF
ncbi:C20orf27 [Branchiostoma lanceolatum]|uniref:Adipose-secreted signaling protein n=1 Tax=Branchiostoma lanceolatum TaxID=7740 RepID=A0A8K0EMK3_BRALA|nr:C20orf27 [Branchiostoma lanceolatum]